MTDEFPNGREPGLSRLHPKPDTEDKAEPYDLEEALAFLHADLVKLAEGARALEDEFGVWGFRKRIAIGRYRLFQWLCRHNDAEVYSSPYRLLVMCRACGKVIFDDR